MKFAGGLAHEAQRAALERGALGCELRVAGKIERQVLIIAPFHEEQAWVSVRHQ
jgi:hypothetical protein